MAAQHVVMSDASPVNSGSPCTKDGGSSPLVQAWVWSVWSLLLLVNVVVLIKFGRIIPLTEDWLCIPALTGNQPHFAQWLWEQNNEHRVPFPKLLIYLVLKAGHGDMRIGMLFNILLLAGLSAALILTTQYLRGWRSSVADAYFPLLLLHLGHAENMFWSWQATQVIPTVLACIVLLAIICDPLLESRTACLLSAISLLMLPLSGGNGLIYTPTLAAWLVYSGVRQRFRTVGGAGWRNGRLLISAALLSQVLTGIYFIGYVRPVWVPSPSSLYAWLESSAKSLAVGFGPIGTLSWALSIIAGLALVSCALILGSVCAYRSRQREQQRAIGMVVFLLTTLGFFLVMGWARANAIAIYGGWPLRYSLFAAPAFCVSFYVLLVCGSCQVRKWGPLSLCVMLLVLLPFNQIRGITWLMLYPEKDDQFLHDLYKGTSSRDLARQYRDLLFHSADTRVLADYMHMLKNAGLAPFVHLRAFDGGAPVETNKGVLEGSSPVPLDLKAGRRPSLHHQTIQYHFPDAEEVILVWGINGWHRAPREQWPPNTELKHNLLHTPMISKDGKFVANLLLPIGSVLDYCFLIVKKRDSFHLTWPLCDGNFRTIVENTRRVEVESKVSLEPVTQEIRYSIPEAGEVFLVWGLNNWHLAPETLRPAGTELRIVKDARRLRSEPPAPTMHSPMELQQGLFVSKIRVPPGTLINYGFLITKTRGLLDIPGPVWQGPHEVFVAPDAVTTMSGTLSFFWDGTHLLSHARYFIAALVLFGALWLMLWGVLAWRQVSRPM